MGRQVGQKISRRTGQEERLRALSSLPLVHSAMVGHNGDVGMIGRCPGSVSRVAANSRLQAPRRDVVRRGEDDVGPPTINRKTRRRQLRHVDVAVVVALTQTKQSLLYNIHM
ncbi:unnamed protein product [Heligmosomoides polygyrus]|uniref:Uncharacterized protein n=1 Tax=Heligmosomoides polygyrus TaxID=6339 RepID=A0A183FDU4_HELPZ|nr:unnamed protein product [Heligmosomoides polygyrus]